MRFVKARGCGGGIPLPHCLEIAAHEREAIKGIFAEITARICVLVRDAAGARSVVYKPEISYVRRHDNSATHVPWHFDTYAAGTIGFDPGYNAWIPFVSAGIDCPTLEFYSGLQMAMREGRYVKSSDGFPAQEWTAARLDPRHLCIPMQFGDVVVFDHFTLHRTQPMAHGSAVRTSAELRLAAEF